MVEQLRRTVTGNLKKMGLTVMSNGRYERLEKNSQDLIRANAAINLILHLPERHGTPLLRLIHESKAQLFQDFFVLSELEFKKEGFFVEFGATNGVELSNTFLLEKHFKWNGILAEPGRSWHEDLRKNRRCNIETACVWRESGSVVTFNATDQKELATIDSFTASDCHTQSRRAGEKYDIDTISLFDLLKKYNAPHVIDYLSIDTEGSEYDILRDFDFDEYRFRVITCEHNFTPQREKLYSLFTQNGYVRRHEDVSDFDDWYVEART